MDVSEKGLAFIGLNEGNVTKTYVDSAGVLTIGRGFTMRSQVFAAWAKQRWGRGLKRGDRMRLDEIEQVFKTLVAHEYAPPVAAKFGAGITQHAFDAAVDTTFNCGAGTLKDKWAKALAERTVATAASLLRSTRVTAGGKKLAGLVKRRARAANLMLDGDYGELHLGSVPGMAPAASNTHEEIREYQRQLADLGYYKGKISGSRDAETLDAIREFQADQPNLVMDGIVGPATRASLDRAVTAKKRAAQTAATAPAAGAGGVVVDAIVNASPNGPAFSSGGIMVGVVVGVVALVALAGFFAWRYRDEIELWLNKRSRV